MTIVLTNRKEKEEKNDPELQVEVKGLTLELLLTKIL